MSITYNGASVRQDYEKLLEPIVTSEGTMQRPLDVFSLMVSIFCN